MREILYPRNMTLMDLHRLTLKSIWTDFPNFHQPCSHLRPVLLVPPFAQPRVKRLSRTPPKPKESKGLLSLPPSVIHRIASFLIPNTTCICPNPQYPPVYAANVISFALANVYLLLVLQTRRVLPRGFLIRKELPPKRNLLFGCLCREHRDAQEGQEKGGRERDQQKKEPQEAEPQKPATPHDEKRISHQAEARTQETAQRPSAAALARLFDTFRALDQRKTRMDLRAQAVAAGRRKRRW